MKIGWIILLLTISACSPQQKESNKQNNQNSEVLIQQASQLVLSPVISGDYGTLLTTAAAVDKNFTIKNTGDAPELPTVSLVGSGFQKVLEQGCTTALVGGSTSSCRVRIRFSPLGKAPGNYSATLNVGSLAIPLSAIVEGASTTTSSGGSTTGGGPVSPYQVTVDSLVVSSFNFGEVATSLDKVFYIKNISSSSSPAATAVVSGAGYSVVLNRCSNKTLTPNSQCDIRVKFTGTGRAAGNYSGSLSFDTLSLNLSATVPGATSTTSSGTTGTPVSNIAFLDGTNVVTSFDYGTFGQSQSLLKAFTIKNTGTSSLPIGTVTLSNTDFTISINQCNNKTLTANGTCSIRVAFNSTGKANGAYAANVQVLNYNFPLTANVSYQLSCPSNQHLESGVCVSNTRSCTSLPPNSTAGIETWTGSNWGQCVPTTCVVNYHVEANTCRPNVKSCLITNGVGSQNWISGSTYSTCTVVSCNQGFDQLNNQCVSACLSSEHRNPTSGLCESNTRSCVVENGVGEQIWNGTDYDACNVVSCNTHYENNNNSCGLKNYNVSISKNPGGTIYGGNSYCGPSEENCSNTEIALSSITYQAQPEEGKLFISWGGDCAAFGSNPICQLIIDGDKNISAQFQNSTGQLLSLEIKDNNTNQSLESSYSAGTSLNLKVIAIYDDRNEVLNATDTVISMNYNYNGYYFEGYQYGSNNFDDQQDLVSFYGAGNHYIRVEFGGISAEVTDIAVNPGTPFDIVNANSGIGAGLSGQAGQSGSMALFGRVLDEYGNGVGLSSLTLSYENSLLGNQIIETDFSGYFYYSPDMPTTSGEVDLTVTSNLNNAVSEVYVYTVYPGAPTQLVYESGNNQSVEVYTQAADLKVKLYDQYNNPLAGYGINFYYEGPQGGQQGAGGATTDENGIASLSWIVPTVAGNYLIKAQYPNVEDVNFSMTVLPGAPAYLEFATQPLGDVQEDQPLTQQPVIHIKDQFANIVTTNNSSISYSLYSNPGCTGSVSANILNAPSQFSSGVAQGVNLSIDEAGDFYLKVVSEGFDICSQQIHIDAAVASAPMITSTSPANNQQISTSGTQITVNFDKLMNVATYENNIYVSGGYAVSINSLLSDSTKVVFTINATIPNNAYYSITLGTNIKSQQNIGLAAPYVFSVYTGTPPASSLAWQAGEEKFYLGPSGFGMYIGLYDKPNRKSLIVLEGDENNSSLVNIVEYKSEDEGLTWTRVPVSNYTNSNTSANVYDVREIGNYNYLTGFSNFLGPQSTDYFIYYNNNGGPWNVVWLPEPIHIPAGSGAYGSQYQVAMSPSGQIVAIYKEAAQGQQAEVPYKIIKYTPGSGWSNPLPIGNPVNDGNYGFQQDARIQYGGGNNFVIVMAQMDANNLYPDYYGITYNFNTNTASTPVLLENEISYNGGAFNLVGNANGVALGVIYLYDPQDSSSLSLRTVHWTGSQWSSMKVAVAPNPNYYSYPVAASIVNRVFANNSAVIAFANYDTEFNDDRGYFVRLNDLTNVNSNWSNKVRFNNHSLSYDFSALGGIQGVSEDLENAGGTQTVTEIMLRESHTTPGQFMLAWKQMPTTGQLRYMSALVQPNNALTISKMSVGNIDISPPQVGYGQIPGYYESSLFSTATGFKYLSPKNYLLNNNPYVTDVGFTLHEYKTVGGSLGAIKKAFTDNSYIQQIDMTQASSLYKTHFANNAAGDRGVFIFRYQDSATGQMSYNSVNYTKSNDTWSGATGARTLIMPVAQYQNNGEEHFEPAFASNANGDVAVAWLFQDVGLNRQRIYIRRYSGTTGTWATQRTVLDLDYSTGSGLSLSGKIKLAMDGSGNAFVSWIMWDHLSETYKLKIRALNAANTLQAENTLISSLELDTAMYNYGMFGGGNNIIMFNKANYAILNTSNLASIPPITFQPLDANMTQNEKDVFLPILKVRAKGNNIALFYNKEVPFQSSYIFRLQMKYFNGSSWSPATVVDSETYGVSEYEAEFISSSKLVIAYHGTGANVASQVIKSKIYDAATGLSPESVIINSPGQLNVSSLGMCAASDGKVAITAQVDFNNYSYNYTSILYNLYQPALGIWQGQRYAYSPIDIQNGSDDFPYSECKLFDSNRMIILMNTPPNNHVYGSEFTKILHRAVNF